MRLYVSPPALSIIKKEIMNELITQLNIARTASLSDITKKARNITKRLIRQSEFIFALRGQELRGSFGIPPGEYTPAIDDLINGISDDTYVFSKPFSLVGNDIKGGWVLAIGSNLFEKLKNVNTLIQDTEKGARLPWFRWTLEEGNKVIIASYRVRFKLGKGRSGFAQMVPNAVIGYRIPPKWTGTDNDNWITRTILPNITEYSEMFLRTLNRHAP